MWNAILGSVIGGVTAGMIVLGVSAAGQGQVDEFEPMGSVPAMAEGTMGGPTDVSYAPSPAASYAPAPAPTAPAATARPAVVRERVVEREAPRSSRRSWGKSALVIGGSSGAGAGIGALIGGKKGALIGAAIGGGSGAIYEVTKRK